MSPGLLDLGIALLTNSGKAQALWYCASKTLAERAAYALVDKIKPPFTLATLNPPSMSHPCPLSRTMLTLVQ